MRTNANNWVIPLIPFTLKKNVKFQNHILNFLEDLPSSLYRNTTNSSKPSKIELAAMEVFLNNFPSKFDPDLPTPATCLLLTVWKTFMLRHWFILV
eukprot:UN26424